MAGGARIHPGKRKGDPMLTRNSKPIIVAVPYVDTNAPIMAPSLLKSVLKTYGIKSTALDLNIKVAAASSMIKTATLSDADYSRLVDYWKNELGYGDQDWIDALFTKKYDKKN